MGSDWLQIQKGDPLAYLIEKEKRSCKGCRHIEQTRLWGIDYNVCVKKKREAVEKCSQWKESE